MKQAKFAVFDIDGTLIRWQLFHAIVHELGKQGYMDETSHQKIRNARMKWKNRGNPDSFKEYETVLLGEYMVALQTIPPEQYHRAVEKVFDIYKDQLFVYTRSLLQQLKKAGYLLFAISGSQDEIVQKLAAYHGFDAAVGAKLITIEGKYTGHVESPVHSKDTALRELVSTYGASFTGSIAVGDSVSDIAMLELVAQPIAFNPEAALYAHAKKHGWKIVVERKNVVYELDHTNKGYMVA